MSISAHLCLGRPCPLLSGSWRVHREQACSPLQCGRSAGGQGTGHSSDLHPQRGASPHPGLARWHRHATRPCLTYPGPQSQSLSWSYRSNLPTSLIYFSLSTRGSSPWRPAVFYFFYFCWWRDFKFINNVFLFLLMFTFQCSFMYCLQYQYWSSLSLFFLSASNFSPIWFSCSKVTSATKTFVGFLAGWVRNKWISRWKQSTYNQRKVSTKTNWKCIKKIH